MVYVFLADGFEEIEALTVVDLLRRAGIAVNTASVTDEKSVTGRSAITVTTDITINDVDWESAEGLVLPGGMPGTANLSNTDILMKNVTAVVSSNDTASSRGCSKFVAAICAAPALLLGANNLLIGKNATCYPGMENHLKGANALTDTVVTDGNIITSRGLGTSVDFALAIITKLLGDKKAAEIAESVVYRQS